MGRFVAIFCACVAMAGAASSETLSIVVPPAVTMPPLPAGAKVQPVSLTRLAANIPAGTPWLQDNEAPYFMLPCVVTGTPIKWVEADNKIEGFDSLKRIFADELKAAGLAISGDSTNLFEDQKSADLQVGALVTGLRVRTCMTVPIGGTLIGGVGAMEVEWQIYSVSQGRIVARVATQGGYELKPRKGGEGATIIGAAFGDNVRRLAADEGFRRLVVSATPVSSPALAVEPRRTELSFAPASVGAVPIATAVKSVVTIFAGEGFGSGVVISQDGYILTNHHVAGSNGRVRVRWADGSETVGEVLRGDPRRDVALIKVSANGAPLPIRVSAAQLGETVFAVGTPLDKTLANTLTRGIVSGTRLIEGQAVIQSDVAIDHGNSGGPLLDEKGQIVALTVSRYEENNVGHDISFFIPIQDALNALGLKSAP